MHLGQNFFGKRLSDSGRLKSGLVLGRRSSTVASQQGCGSLIEVGCSTCRFDALLLGFCQCLDMAIHGVLVNAKVSM
jgi:hypothetical protein